MSATTKRPLFSIVTAVFNGAETIEATIESLNHQTFRDFEHIVIDGASTDTTTTILAKWQKTITWVSEPDAGLYDALNKGLRYSRGEWISFMGADDIYYPYALEKYAAAIAARPTGSLHYVSSKIELAKRGKALRIVGSPWAWPTFAHHMTVAHVGSMHHRSLFDQYGIFDASYLICGDYELLLRPRDALRSAFIDAVTARMALGGMSNVRIRDALIEQARAKQARGGRAAWRCALEYRLAYLKALCRRMLSN